MEVDEANPATCARFWEERDALLQVAGWLISFSLDERGLLQHAGRSGGAGVRVGDDAGAYATQKFIGQ
jgi:hypothetical protein